MSNTASLLKTSPRPSFGDYPELNHAGMVPPDRRLIDTLAAFEAEGEDLEFESDENDDPPEDNGDDQDSLRSEDDFGVLSMDSRIDPRQWL